MKERNRACFLDRDGVINRAFVKNGKPYPPATLQEFEILEGVKESLELLRKSGFLNIIVTNQPDVARGIQKKEVVDAMHHKIMEELAIDDIFACFEEDGPNCNCYKPKPGMLLQARDKHGINLKRSFMIGDRWRDVGAGIAAGCKTIFIDYKYEEPLTQLPDYVCSNLFQGTKFLLTIDKI